MTDAQIAELFDRNPNLLMGEMMSITGKTPKEIKDILLNPTKKVMWPEPITLSASDIFHHYAPSFNFELDQEALVAKALKRGFVTMVGIDQYLVNQDYEGVETDD